MADLQTAILISFGVYILLQFQKMLWFKRTMHAVVKLLLCFFWALILSGLVCDSLKQTILTAICAAGIASLIHKMHRAYSAQGDLSIATILHGRSGGRSL